jgi:hypothetical protein
MSALPPKADIGTRSRNVRYMPKAPSAKCRRVTCEDLVAVIERLFGKFRCHNYSRLFFLSERPTSQLRSDVHVGGD